MSQIYFHPIPYGIGDMGADLPTDMAIITNTSGRTRKLIVVGTDEQIALLAQLAFDLGEGTFIKNMRKLAGCPDG